MEKIITAVMRYVEAEEFSSWPTTDSDGNLGDSGSSGGGGAGGVEGYCISYQQKGFLLLTSFCLQ